MYKTFRYIFPCLLAGIGMLFTGCADDAINLADTSQPEGDTEYFVKLRLNTFTGSFSTRGAGDTYPGAELVDGEHNEHAISKNGNFAIFFDEEGSYISCADLYSVNEIGNGHHPADDSKPQTESEYTTRFYGFADRKPAQVLVVVNASDRVKNQVKNFPGFNVEQAMKLVWEENGTYQVGHDKNIDDPYDHLGIRMEDGVKYYTMTNTTYLEKDDDGSNVLRCAEAIKDENVSDDEEQIENLEPVTVYLERMVSKYEFSMTNTDGNTFLPYDAQSLDVCIYTDGEYKYYDYKWAVEVLGWGINGLERENYLFKNVDPEGLYFEDYPSWNSTYDRRCWWSEDPHYYKGVGLYPWQTRDAKDMENPEIGADVRTNFHYYSNETPDHPYSLTYYPYSWFLLGNNEYDDSHLFDENGKLINFQYKGSDKVVYTPENTFAPGMIVDRSKNSGNEVYTRAYELAGSHLLLACRLKYDDTGSNNYKYFEGDNAHLYRNRVGVCYIEEVSMFEDFMNAVNYKLESQKYLYYNYYNWNPKDNERGAVAGTTFRAKSGGHYALYYYNKRENEYRELTYREIQKIRDRATENYPDQTNLPEDYTRAYKLTIDAYTQNGDGKILPWICYRAYPDDPYEELEMVILGPVDEDNPDYLKYCNSDPETGAEIIGGSKFTVNEVSNYIDTRKLEFQKNNGNWVDFDSSIGEERDNNDLKSLFYEIWGVADHFNHGMMYYAIPIHALDNRNNYAVASAVGSNTDYYTDKDKYYYGVIRNNWYKFTLRTINEIGVPVSNPYQDIVPNYNKKLDQIKVEMEILQWHLEDIKVPIY